MILVVLPGLVPVSCIAAAAAVLLIVVVVHIDAVVGCIAVETAVGVHIRPLVPDVAQVVVVSIILLRR